MSVFSLIHARGLERRGRCSETRSAANQSLSISLSGSIPRSGRPHPLSLSSLRPAPLVRAGRKGNFIVGPPPIICFNFSNSGAYVGDSRQSTPHDCRGGGFETRLYQHRNAVHVIGHDYVSIQARVLLCRLIPIPEHIWASSGSDWLICLIELVDAMNYSDQTRATTRGCPCDCPIYGSW